MLLLLKLQIEKLMLKSKDANEKAGGIAEELLYNIKTITCFCNFDFEIKRYNELIDEIDQYDQKKVLIESVAYGLLYLASFGSVAFVLVHARHLIRIPVLYYLWNQASSIPHYSYRQDILFP